MRQPTTVSTPPSSEKSIFGSLTGESFSSLLRGLTLPQPLKNIVSLLRKAPISDWHVDEITNVVSIVSSDQRVSISPKSSGSDTWLAASTRWGASELSRNAPEAGLIERTISQRLESWRIELANEIPPSWLAKMAGAVTDKSLGWVEQQDEVERFSFGQGSYRETILATFSTTTDSGLSVVVRQLDTLRFISFADAYQEDRRYAEQCVELARREYVPIFYVFPPLVLYSTLPTFRQPDPPQSYGTTRALSRDIYVNSIAIDNISRAFDLPLTPVAHARLEKAQ